MQKNAGVRETAPKMRGGNEMYGQEGGIKGGARRGGWIGNEEGGKVKRNGGTWWERRGEWVENE